MLLTKKYDIQKFELYLKPTYKSTSLNWQQFYLVLKGIYNLLLFKINFIIKANNGK